MVYSIPKDKIPQQQYTPAKFKDEIVMMTVVPRGVVIMFLDMNENIFVDWDEIVAYAATAPRKTPPTDPEDEQAATPEKKSSVKEIKPTRHP